MAEPTRKTDPYGQLESEVSEDLHPVLQYITDHLKHFAIGIGAVLLAVGAYAALSAYQEAQEEKAENKLGAILVNPQPEARIEQLRAYLQNAPERLETSARLALAKALMDEEQYEQAAEVWGQIKEDSGELRYVAWLGQSKCLLKAGQAEKALQELSSLKAKAPESYQTAASRQTAEAAEAAGQYAVAIRNYQKIASQAQPEDRAYLEARIKELEKKL
jgi:hypothetical protein